MSRSVCGHIARTLLRHSIRGDYRPCQQSTVSFEVLNPQILKDFSSCAFVGLQNDFHYIAPVDEFRNERNTITIEFTFPSEGEYICGLIGGRREHALGISRLNVSRCESLDSIHHGIHELPLH
jgi:hypothetical protein